jgi:hypothetical protein
MGTLQKRPGYSAGEEKNSNPNRGLKPHIAVRSLSPFLLNCLTFCSQNESHWFFHVGFFIGKWELIQTQRRRQGRKSDPLSCGSYDLYYILLFIMCALDSCRS